MEPHEVPVEPHKAPVEAQEVPVEPQEAPVEPQEDPVTPAPGCGRYARLDVVVAFAALIVPSCCPAIA